MVPLQAHYYPEALPTTTALILSRSLHSKEQQATESEGLAQGPNVAAGALFLQPSAGASIPSETMMHFPPCFRFSPLFSKNFQTLRKIFTILPSPEKFLDFHPPKFLMTFYNISPLIRENL